MDETDEFTDELTQETRTSETYVMVQVNAVSLDEAERIAQAVVDGGLASSAQIAPVRTRYRWEGAVHVADEHLITMYTRRDRFDALARCVRAQHSYEVPQIVALPIVDATASFLHWIDDSTDAVEPEAPPDVP